MKKRRAFFRWSVSARNQIVDEAVQGAFGQFLTVKPTPLNQDEPFIPDDSGGDSDGTWQYELSLIECGDQEVTECISSTVQAVVTALSQALPLKRLDEITIAYDYPSALRAVDRGIENVPPAETISSEIGTGIAKMVTVLRSTEVKGRIVLASSVAQALIGEDPTGVEWAVHVLVKELAHVAMIEVIERTLPGTYLTPITDEYKGWLYAQVDAALHGYLTSYIAAGFGDRTEIANEMRQVVVRSIDRMCTFILEERLSYRYHGDLDHLLAVVLPLSDMSSLSPRTYWDIARRLELPFSTMKVNWQIL